MSELPTFRDQVIARKDDAHTAIRFEDESYSYAEYVQCCAQRAAYLLENRQAGPLHVGVLLENVPEVPIWVGAAAIAGATLVGINPTRRGAELARDIAHTDCQLIVTEGRYRELLDGLDGLPSADRILDVDSPEYREAIAPYSQAEIPNVEVRPTDTLLLIFTSGTSGAPKAVICSQMKLTIMGQSLIGICGLGRDTVSYQAMPLFHSNGLFTGYAPTLIAGGTAALRRKFSASGFIEDVRKFGATYFNYVGKPLSYILATEQSPDDSDNTLEFVFGNEAADLDIARFQKRFGVHVQDGYGSTETGASISRTEEMPEGALGVGGEGVLVLDPETQVECPRARFDDKGRLLNAEEATGEIVNTAGGGFFEGYYKNDEANAARLRDGMFWTGDLGYRDDAGYFYFAGRDFEWLRVDGENFSAAPLERILARFGGIVLASVYAVPDVEVGDQVMAALQVNDPERFDAAAFESFLAQQSDLGTKWAPRYLRLSHSLPVTQTSKVQKRQLRAERWECDEPVYVAQTPGERYRLMTDADVAELREAFEARGRASQLA
jgi:fatty-acyl-CoA synthase